MMSSPASSNNTDKAVLLWDEWYVYRWENDKNESLTPIASLKELPQVSQILQLDTNDIVVLSAQSDTISYVNLHSRTAEVLLCNDEGCCSQSDSERCHQQSNSSQISEISLNSQDHVSVFFSDKAAIKKFRINESLIQPEVIIDLSDHVDSLGKIKTFTFNEDYSIIFLLWKTLDNEKNLLYRYHIHYKTMSEYIEIQEKLAKISSLGENIVLGLDEEHKQLVALDFESDKSISSWVCLVNATAGSPGYSDGDDNSSECNTPPHSITMMTQDDNYIYAMDSANNILAIDNIKGGYHRLGNSC